VEVLADWLERESSREGELHLIHLRGPEASGKRWIAKLLARRVGRRAVACNLADVDGPESRGDRLATWLRDVRLERGLPCVDASDVPADASERAVHDVMRALEEHCFDVAFLLTEQTTPPRYLSDRIRLVPIEMPVPRPALRARAWEHFLGMEGLAYDAEAIRGVASVFSFPIGQIRRASREAASTLRISDPAAQTLDGATLRAACRASTRHRLSRLAEAVPLVHSLSDLVLPEDQTRQLQEIVDAVRGREHVLERWGFGRKVCVTPGVSVLFSGSSGTGKTMAAGVVAAELGMELFRVDLSRVVSKYIGETEKHLDALFTEARGASAVLLFDEADALFGKRSEVKDAHDRYANIEVAYLLQRMEASEGVTVLATNLRRNLDTAFVRRLQFAVEFPAPSAELRLRIWQRVWPAEATLAPDVDLGFMARQFEIAGGNVRNIALRAAFLAAHEETAIGMRHIVTATRREFQKMGHVSIDDEFGAYRQLLLPVART
jgi:hypothetical protein